MTDYIDREKYCNEICHCNQNYCDKPSCPIWKAPSVDVTLRTYGHWIKYAGNLLICSACGYQLNAITIVGIVARKWTRYNLILYFD